jgi:DNA-binding SARP family transcriptional activator
MYSLKLLGCVGLEGPSGLVDCCAIQPRRMACLALLDSSRLRGMSREKILSYLWPDDDSARARHHLSDSLYGLKTTLGAKAVIAVGDSLHLNPDVIRSDVSKFHDALERGDLKDAIQIYAGPFLDGFFIRNTNGFEYWAERERQRLAACQTVALTALATESKESGDFADSAIWWKRLVTQDPFSARAVSGLMKALEDSGESAKALLASRAYQTRLMSELGMESCPALLALADDIRRRNDHPD